MRKSVEGVLYVLLKRKKPKSNQKFSKLFSILDFLQSSLLFSHRTSAIYLFSKTASLFQIIQSIFIGYGEEFKPLVRNRYLVFIYSTWEMEKQGKDSSEYQSTRATSQPPDGTQDQEQIINEDVVPSTTTSDNDTVQNSASDEGYLHGLRLVSVMCAVTLAAFLMILDSSVVVTVCCDFIIKRSSCPVCCGSTCWCTNYRLHPELQPIFTLRQTLGGMGLRIF